MTRVLDIARKTLMKLVIVESPTKMKTVGKYLGGDYRVESSVGHVRDLPQSAGEIPEKYKKEEWSRIGIDVKHNFLPLYVIPDKKKKVVANLKKALKNASELILATDSDREGESISAHLLEVLQPKVPVKRMVFHEITEESINEALKNTRKIDEDLVSAQEARRILDRLVGYLLSPVLWRNVAFGLSAGRVQSVAVRLLAERELERLAFVKSIYLDAEGEFEAQKAKFKGDLISLDSKPLATSTDFDSKTGKLLKAKVGKVKELDSQELTKLLDKLQKAKFTVTDVAEKPVSRSPLPPFITSSLQQAANNKFGWSAKETMRTAQSLYEEGYITYMRTDSVFLSSQALTATRAEIKNLFGRAHLPEKPRFYANKKASNAQEAHEAIRPSGSKFKSSEEHKLSGDKHKLYKLIYQRTLASQMKNAEVMQSTVLLQAHEATFKATGTKVIFPGFLKVWGANDTEMVLPALKVHQEVKLHKLEAKEHETKPPARFTEASLIKTLEEEGVGRPSTYASIISTIIDREYAVRESTTLKPTFTAMIVNKLLCKHFPEYVDLKYTAKLEEQLDDIADGKLKESEFLKDFYFGKNGLEDELAREEPKIKPDESRSIVFEQFKDIEFRVGRYGPYVSMGKGKKEISASIPLALAPADVTMEAIQLLIEQKENGVDAIGSDPVSGKKVYALVGRFGPYVQLGEPDEKKPKRVSVPPSLETDKVTLKKALYLLSFPLSLGINPKSKKDVKLGQGRFGPYILHDGEYRSVPKALDLFELKLKDALEIMATPKKTRGGRSARKALKVLGKHPIDAKPVSLHDGRYGMYVSWGKVNATLPKNIDEKKLSLEKAIEILNNKAK